MQGIVYMLRCRLNGKRYIGRTVRTLRKRIFEHIRDARNRPETEFDKDLSRYGIKAFDIITLELCEVDKLIQAEAFHIFSIDPEYNRVASGAGGNQWLHTRVTRPRSKRQRRKIAESVKLSHQCGWRKLEL